MRGYVIFCVVLAVLAAAPFEAKAVILLQEDFETEANFVRSTAGINSPDTHDFFGATQTLGSFVGAVGMYYAGEDINGMTEHVGYEDNPVTYLPQTYLPPDPVYGPIPGGPSTYTASGKGALIFPTINISGVSDVKVSLLVAAADSVLNVSGFDISTANGDELSIQASKDGGAFFEVGHFQSMPSPEVWNGSNSPLREITSLTIVGSTFSDWTFDVPGTGSTLDLRVVMRSTSGGEIIAIDNLRVTAAFDPATVFLPGDANMDWAVNVADLTLLLNNYNKSSMAWANGDFNADGSVNVADLTALLNNYNKTGGLGGIAGAAVPEPASLVMLAGLALTALLYGWRKRV